MEYVFFMEDSYYNKFGCNAVRGKKGAHLIPGFRSPLERKLFRLHNAWPLNQYFELPGKGIWYRCCLDERALDKNAEICFIFYESFHMAYSGQFLRYLRKNYPNGKCFYAFTNPVEEYNLAKLRTVQKYYDVVLTFEKESAEKYGFAYGPIDLYGPESIPESDLPESDVFFIGADKGRLDTLLGIYEALTAKGLRCDFYITGVPEEKQKYAREITYNRPISYEESLKHLAKTKCVLEVLQNGLAYGSVRMSEAYAYRKKLLTTNLRMEQAEHYDPRIARVIRDPKDIDASFIQNDVSEEVYAQYDFYTFEAFQRMIAEVKGEKL